MISTQRHITCIGPLKFIQTFADNFLPLHKDQPNKKLKCSDDIASAKLIKTDLSKPTNFEGNAQSGSGDDFNICVYFK